MEKQRLLFEAVFKRMPSAPETSSWLQEVAAAHPYFSAAQFFLLQQTGINDPACNLQQARKASVLFNNPGWLQFQLLKSAEQTTPAEIAVSYSGNPEASVIEPVQEEQESNEASIPENPVVPVNEDIPVSVNSREITPASVPGPEQKPEPELPAGVATAVISVSETEPEETDKISPAAPETLPAHIPLPETAPADTALLFEPLHTTDYFASVGIKLSEQEKTNDRLGKQLKSFTDWLKTMKKVPGSQPVTAPPADAVEAAANESHIRHLAEQSNQEGEVLTEAMAGVLLQQGRKEKAIEILEKLSLLNPAKSTYFAAKIHQIKGD